jgi:osmotically-inducible protein OsmY
MVTESELTTDERVQRRVLDTLHWDSELSPTEIGVEVDYGVVTLIGDVESDHKKWMAERVALEVEGVRGVANELQVRGPATFQPTDTQIALSAVKFLDWNASVPKGRVKVGVSNGSVILEGTVRRPHEKIAAERAVHRVHGVRDVTSLIKVSTDVVAVPVPIDTKQLLPL